MTLSEYLDTWGRGSGGRFVSEGWASLRVQKLRRAVEIFGDVELENIEPRHGWALQKKCLEDGLAYSSVNRAVAALRALLRDAAKERCIPRVQYREFNADVVDMRERPDSRYDPWTIEERDLILAEAPRVDPRFVPLTEFIFATGVRPGELAILEGADFSLRERRCHVRGTKTENSDRHIGLGDRAVAVIAPLLPAIGPVFRSANGARLNRHNLSRRFWQPLMHRLEGRVTNRPLQCARHTFISLQLSTGNMTPVEVAAYCGTSVEVIYDRYLRYIPTRPLDVDKGLRPRRLQLVKGGKR